MNTLVRSKNYLKFSRNLKCFRIFHKIYFRIFKFVLWRLSISSKFHNNFSKILLRLLLFFSKFLLIFGCFLKLIQNFSKTFVKLLQNFFESIILSSSFWLAIFLLQATDEDGKGHSTSVPLKISVLDSNDNPPIFQSKNYTADIEEGSTKFEPPFFVKVSFRTRKRGGGNFCCSKFCLNTTKYNLQAVDADKTSGIAYSIMDENAKGLFGINHVTGEIIILNEAGILRDNNSDTTTFTVTVSSEYFELTQSVNKLWATECWN